MKNTTSFLPTTASEHPQGAGTPFDFVIISGDAYVDHPSFGAALIGRVVQSCGYSVGIIPQPDWHDPQSFRVLGRPRVAFLISAGNMDSMVSNYTSAGKPRRRDSFSPGGRGGRRPDRATLVYTTMAKQAYKGVATIIGGVEASLRRMGHYDYWSNRVRHSILQDAKADMLLYGMAEPALLELLRRLRHGEELRSIEDLRGSVINRAVVPAHARSYISLPSFSSIRQDRHAYGRSFLVQAEENDPFRGRGLIEKDGARFIIQNPPAHPLTTKELDDFAELPYTRRWHPMYTHAGGVPALKEVQFSLLKSRGCFGACSFCAITFHQGRYIRSRSEESLVREACHLRDDPDFKGIIHDVGGPTANFTHPSCDGQEERGLCKKRHCLYPTPCKKLRVDHRSYLSLLRRLRALPGIKRVFIRSGIRYDYLCADPDKNFFSDLVKYHVSGRLKVAPEHCDPEVLACMGKPSISVFETFHRQYRQYTAAAGKKQYLVPYFISSHPGATLHHAIALAEYMRDAHLRVDQVQDFLPTPATLSTTMYYTGIDPRTGKSVYVPRNAREKRLQRALLQYYKKENAPLVREALRKAGRHDLIGRGKRCLVGRG